MKHTRENQTMKITYVLLKKCFIVYLLNSYIIFQSNLYMKNWSQWIIVNFIKQYVAVKEITFQTYRNREWNYNSIDYEINSSN